MSHGTHNAVDDPRNEEVLVYVNGELLPRQDAKISVFDSGYLVGDGVWEGLRLHDGVWAPHLYENLHRSTGFQPYQAKEAAFPDTLEPLLAECQPYYDQLLQLAIH